MITEKELADILNIKEEYICKTFDSFQIYSSELISCIIYYYPETEEFIINERKVSSKENLVRLFKLIQWSRFTRIKQATFSFKLNSNNKQGYIEIYNSDFHKIKRAIKSKKFEKAIKKINALIGYKAKNKIELTTAGIFIYYEWDEI